MRTFAIAFLVLCFVIPSPCQPQPAEPFGWAIDVQQSYWIVPNLTYSVADGYESKLDVYARRSAKGPVPTVVNIHGGGWVGGTKEGNNLQILPYIEMGFSVVNVEYRLARVALAPGAVEDCRLALRWVMKNAKTYNFDTSRIVVTGGSAGGHLALITGMLDSTAGFDSPKDWDQINPVLKVAAIVNWFGITDVKDLLSGPNRQNYAVSWIGSARDGEEMARRVSPLTYVRKDLPPIFSIHGTSDQLVPYSHATRLHAALDKAGVPNRLVTIPNGKHGGFSREEMLQIYTGIRDFFKQHKIL
jgi:acetyl esterase/lipase